MKKEKLIFSIILVVYDPWDNFSHPDALPKAIKSLDLLEGDFELIIVINDDIENCPKTTSFLRDLRDEKPNIKLLELSKNLGCSGGFNRGVNLSDEDTEVIIYLSCDAFIVDPLVLTKISEVFQKYPIIAALHPVSIYEDSNEINFSKAYSRKKFQNQVEIMDYEASEELPDNSLDEILGISNSVKNRKCKPVYPLHSLPLTFYAVRRKVYELLGGFDEEFIAGYENIDFALRALQKGHKSAILNNSFIFHRRLLFRFLGQAGINQALLNTAVKNGKPIWKKKWRQEPMDAYYQILYGKFWGQYFGSHLNRINNFMKSILPWGKHCLSIFDIIDGKDQNK